MIDTGHGLRHSVVICIFGFESKFLICTRPGGTKASAVSTDTTIGSDSPQSGAAIFDQPQSDVIPIGRALLRSAINHPHEIIVHKRGAYSELALFQCQDTLVIPRRLPESSECHRMLLTQGSIRGFGVV